jgi:hypothetical protein
MKVFQCNDSGISQKQNNWAVPAGAKLSKAFVKMILAFPLLTCGLTEGELASQRMEKGGEPIK